MEVHENNQNPVIGIHKYRQVKEKFLETVSEWKTAQPIHVAIGEGVTMVEWFLHYIDIDLG
ncbi:MAG: hypothetical protein U5K51_13520 [Flavobacteriaceae bacterium]|nr:hypothetical protein [Flavobacteriaceae bacterium]